MLHYNPRHVSSTTTPIFRRINCIITAYGIVTLCKQLYRMPVESRLYILQSTVWHTVQSFTESDDTRCYDNTIYPPEDGHGNARNMSRIIMLYTYCYRIKVLCIKLVIETSIYYDARSEEHQITLHHILEDINLLSVSTNYNNIQTM